MSDPSADPKKGSVGGRRKRGGGRAARLARNEAGGTVNRRTDIKRALPSYDLLGDEALQRIEEHADWILREIGIEFRGNENALQLFRSAGANVTGTRVGFETGLARSLCSTAPSSFRMHGRDPALSDHVGG